MLLGTLGGSLLVNVLTKKAISEPVKRWLIYLLTGKEAMTAEKRVLSAGLR